MSSPTSSINSSRRSGGGGGLSSNTFPPPLFHKPQEARWGGARLEQQLFGPSSERTGDESTFSKEQILLALFPAPAEAPATEKVLVPATGKAEPRPRRQFAIKSLEKVT